MKTAHRGYQPVAPGRFSCKLDRRFSAFSARVAEKHALQTGRCDLDQFFHQPPARVIKKYTRAGNQTFCLVRKSSRYRWIGVTNVGNAYTSGAVQILSSLIIP